MTSAATKWVVGCDGSKGSEHALEWCLALAAGRAEAVHLARAWQYPTLVGGGYMAIPDIDVEPDAVHPELERIASECAAIGVELTSAVEYGVATNVMLEASTDAQLLVLGTRGLGGFGRLLLGSVSQQCATHARIPVAIVPTTAVIDGDVQRIVVGMDRSAGACAALRWATEFASKGATIQVVGAWQPSSWGANFDLYEAAADHDAARVEFDAVVDDLEASSTGVAIERHFAGGHAADVLLDAAEGADVIVVGERGHRGLKAALLGSTATEVLHRAELTTVIVPVPDDGE